jgi:hypothetical protein
MHRPLLRKRRNQVPETGDFFLTPGASKTFQPQACGLISITVMACDSFKFKKRGQLFFRTPNVTLSVVAVRVSNEDCARVGIN